MNTHWSANGDDDGREERGLPSCDDTIIPDNIISLEASDAFIKGRIMKLPESAVAGTRNSEEGMRWLHNFVNGSSPHASS